MLGSCGDISILVQKMATRAMDLFSTFSAKIEKQLIREVLRSETKNLVPIECMWHQFIIPKKFYFDCNLSKFMVSSIFGQNILNESMALVAVFGTNIEIFLHESKQLPKWWYLMEKNFKIFQK